jgi:hypothetical protein
MQNNLLNNDLEHNYREALKDIGYDLVCSYRIIIDFRPNSMRKNWTSTSAMESWGE